jgi:hypothetical protein
MMETSGSAGRSAPTPVWGSNNLAVGDSPSIKALAGVPPRSPQVRPADTWKLRSTPATVDAHCPPPLAFHFPLSTSQRAYLHGTPHRTWPTGRPGSSAALQGRRERIAPT